MLHFIGIGPVKNLPGPVTGEKPAFHRAVTATIVVLVVVLLFISITAIILIVLCGKNVHKLLVC